MGAGKYLGTAADVSAPRRTSAYMSMSDFLPPVHEPP